MKNQSVTQNSSGITFFQVTSPFNQQQELFVEAGLRQGRGRIEAGLRQGWGKLYTHRHDKVTKRVKASKDRFKERTSGGARKASSKTAP